MSYTFRNRHGKLYFRIAVPAELQPMFGRKEIRRSLGTADKRVGKNIALTLASQARQMFDQMRSKAKKHVQPDSFKALVVDLANNQVKLESPYTEQEFQDAARLVKQLGVGGKAAPIPAAPAKPIADVWKLYADYKIKASRWRDYTPATMQGSFDRYLEHCTTHTLDPWQKKSAIHYRDHLLSTFAASTATLQMERLGSFGAWAVENEHSLVNPFQGVRVQKPKDKPVSKELKRRPYTHDEIAIVQKALDVKKDARHWIVWCGMYTGARINELAQLHVADIKTTNGIHHFDLTTLDEKGNKAKDKRIKNSRSIRFVPIHPQLVKLGFLVYVEKRRKAGESLVFDFTLRDTGRGGSASRWYTSYRRSIGIEKVFHAFRDTMSDALLDVGAPEIDINRILGHTPGTSMSVNVYGTSYLPTLDKWMRKVPVNPGRK